jgi:hypothetical protein
MENNFLEQKPLWVSFPEMKPENLTDTQGLYDAVNILWSDFWNPLTPEQKEIYLNHWDASQEWREMFRFFQEMLEIDTDEE